MQETPLFLTADEIRVITEYSRCAEQRRELRHLGIRFIVSRTGKPVVPREALDELFGTGMKGPKRDDVIDISALREAMNNGA